MIDPTALHHLFDQTVGLPAADRAAFLDRACSTDASELLEGQSLHERLLAGWPSSCEWPRPAWQVQAHVGLAA